MTEELLAYLLEDLCPERRQVVEHNIAIDPAWRRELERLQQCLAAGGDRENCSCQDEAPPEDLLTRTCFLVEHACHCHDDEDDAAAQATLDPARQGSLRSERAKGVSPSGVGFLAEAAGGALARHWSLWDVGVGAGVLLALGALMTPALHESRHAARRVTCDANLRALATHLYEYQRNHARQLPSIEPGQSAATFVTALRDEAGATEEQLRVVLICPDSQLAAAIAAGKVRFRFPSKAQLLRATPAERGELLAGVPCSYAIRVGYYDVEDQYRQLPYTGDPHLAMLSDAPEVTPDGVRSANHPCGQNVLYECLGARFRSNCLADDNRDNLYLNRAGWHAAGTLENDVVLLHPQRTPVGELVPVVNVQ